MKITFFSIAMSIIWGSALMLVFSALRKKRQLIDICSITGIVILYVFCAIRMLVPIELPWVYVIPAEVIYNPVYKWIRHSLPGGITVWQILLAIWGLGSIVVLSRLISKYIVLERWIKSKHGDAEIIACEDYGISANSRVRIFKAHGVDVPMSVGILNKEIIIPDRDYSEEEMRLIIRHEIAHIKNGDPVIQLMSNLLCAIYWWNPAAYIFKKDLEQYFELRCDKAVVSEMSKKEAADYLEVLLRIYSESSGSPQKNTVGVIEDYRVGGEELKERFEYLSSGYDRRRKPYIGRSMAVFISIVLLVVSYSFIFQSNYRAMSEQFKEDGDGFEVTPDNSYLIRLDDGRYLWHTYDGFESEISRETAEILIKDGFAVK